MKLSLSFFLAGVVATANARNPTFGEQAASAIKAQKGGEAKKLRVKAAAQQKGKSSSSDKSSRSGSGDATPVAATFSSVYSMTNQAENEVVIYSRDLSDGTLTYQGSVATGGAGASLAATEPADPLASQGAMQVAGSCLLVVNAGSSTVSSFSIQDEATITLVGQYSTNGFIPVSIAVRDDLVYVLNAGGSGNGSLQGYNLESDCTLHYPLGVVEIGQDDVGPTFPLNGLGSPSQVGFTPAGNLLVNIKVNGGANNLGTGNGLLIHYEVQRDGSLHYPSSTVVSRTSLPFAFTFDASGNLLLAEVFDGSFGAANGAVTVWEEEDGSYNQIDTVSIPRALTCWISYNPSNQCAYTSNADLAGSISSVETAGGNYALNNAEAASAIGPIDLITDVLGENLYVLSPGTAFTDDGSGDRIPRVHVYSAADDCQLTEVQVLTDGFDTSFIDGNGVAGLAIFPSA